MGNVNSCEGYEKCVIADNYLANPAIDINNTGLFSWFFRNKKKITVIDIPEPFVKHTAYHVSWCKYCQLFFLSKQLNRDEERFLEYRYCRYSNSVPSDKWLIEYGISKEDWNKGYKPPIVSMLAIDCSDKEETLAMYKHYFGNSKGLPIDLLWSR